MAENWATKAEMKIDGIELRCFGTGYPGKTWRHAACEVAWKKLKKDTNSPCVICFFRGKYISDHTPIWFPVFNENFEIIKNFNDFQARFLETLDAVDEVNRHET